MTAPDAGAARPSEGRRRSAFTLIEVLVVVVIIAVLASIVAPNVFNDSAGALTRLVDLGVAPFLVAATVEAVLAQRLVRTVCRACVSEEPATDAERSALDAPALVTVARGRGCAECRGSGYSGRTGVYELLVLDDAMRGP